LRHGSPASPQRGVYPLRENGPEQGAGRAQPAATAPTCVMPPKTVRRPPPPPPPLLRDPPLQWPVRLAVTPQHERGSAADPPAQTVPNCAYRRLIAAGMGLLCAALKQAMQCCETALPPSASVTVRQRRAHRINRDSPDQPRQESAAKSDPDRECARERLPRYDIAVTDGEAGDEGEVNRVPDRPALEKADQEAEAKLDHEDRRQDRPSNK